MRILVVEDHVQTGKLLVRLLKLRGHDAQHAPSAADALRVCPGGGFDVVVCDIGLPDMDGWELMARVRQLCPGIPAIALSGYGEPEDFQRSADAGFAEHLVKPVTMEALDEAVRRVGRGPEDVAAPT